MKTVQSLRLSTFAVMVLALAATTLAAYAQDFSVLYNFGSKLGDPFGPLYSGILAQGRDGNLYGTAYGGANGIGSIFRITPSGKLTVLYSFDGTQGAAPYGGVTLGQDGDLYGTAVVGGTADAGTIFRITPAGSLTVLHNFIGGGEGASPYGPPVQGADGNYYGTTSLGGATNDGTVYKITPSGALTTLHAFNITDGFQPVAPLVQGTDGSFYGTALSGGSFGNGTIFKITATGKLTVIYNFDGVQGAFPYGPLIQANDGNFYGSAAGGGASGAGVLFKLTPAGALTVLHDLNGTTEGAVPYAGLVQASDGKLYGANSQASPDQGTIFSMTSTGALSVLHTFDGLTGGSPSVTLVQHTNGALYGDTFQGGTGNVTPCVTGSCGVFYSFNPGLTPFVSLVPASAKVGHSIGILGQGLTGTTSVSFNGTAATYTVSSDTFLKVTVPTGATSGFVTVTTPGGTLRSNKKFRVMPGL